MADILLASDGSPYEDLISLEPIPIKNAYLLDGRYYDIASLYVYVKANGDLCVVPHTRKPLSREHQYAILNHSQNNEQRHYVRVFSRGHTASEVEYIEFDDFVPVGTIVYEKNGLGRINQYKTIVPYFKNTMTCFVHTREKTIKAVDIIGCSFPSDQIGVV